MSEFAARVQELKKDVAVRSPALVRVNPNIPTIREADLRKRAGMGTRIFMARIRHAPPP